MSSGPPGSRPKLKGLTAGMAPTEESEVLAIFGTSPPSSFHLLNFGTPVRSFFESTSSGFNASTVFPDPPEADSLFLSGFDPVVSVVPAVVPAVAPEVVAVVAAFVADAC